MMRVNHRETAEDLVQETFISAVKARETFKGDSSEKTWLVAILKNKIIDYYRKKDLLRDNGHYLEITEREFSDHFFDHNTGHWLRDAAPRAWSEPADMALDQEEFQDILQQCVKKMPPRLAPVFIARFFDDEDAESICKVHGISSSNYWVMIHRARVLIRSCLEKNWFHPR